MYYFIYIIIGDYDDNQEKCRLCWSYETYSEEIPNFLLIFNGNSIKTHDDLIKFMKTIEDSILDYVIHCKVNDLPKKNFNDIKAALILMRAIGIIYIKI